MQKEMNLESLFSLNKHLESLKDEMVERLDEVVDFEIFRDFLTEVLGYGYKLQGGRPPFDPVLMLKILILQMMGNYSDKRTELLVRGYQRRGTTDTESTPKTTSPASENPKFLAFAHLIRLDSQENRPFPAKIRIGPFQI